MNFGIGKIVVLSLHMRFLSFQIVPLQGSHRLEKYLNIQNCLEKSLKIKFALKSTGKQSKALKSP